MRMLRLIVGVVLLIASSAAFAQVGESFSGEVVSVTDGDTIRVMRNGESVRVRLEGIDCPERSQDFSQRATQLTSSLVFGNIAHVEVRDVDQYGRLVARVVVDELDVSVALVEQGLAWHYRQYSDDPVLAAAEQAARTAKVGLWGRPNPIPPWNYRRGGAVMDGPLHGNTRSRVFHRAGCPNYNCPNCTVVFETAEEAVGAGFRPAGDCHP